MMTQNHGHLDFPNSVSFCLLEEKIEKNLKRRTKKKKSDYRTDDVVTVTGILNLNADDINHFNYILTDCTVKRAK